MAPEVKTDKNSKLPKLPENCFEPIGKGGWPLISTWITPSVRQTSKTSQRRMTPLEHGGAS